MTEPSAPRDESSDSNDVPQTLRRLRSLRSLFLSHFILANETAYFLLASALDFFVTYVLLAWPDSPVHEANPIARRMFRMGLGYLLAFKFGAATISIVACEMIARRRHRLGRTILIALTLLVAAVAAYGVKLFLTHLVWR
jgi:hypothetical protein